jgi:hypothetical protein
MCPTLSQVVPLKIDNFRVQNPSIAAQNVVPEVSIGRNTLHCSPSFETFCLILGQIYLQMLALTHEWAAHFGTLWP